MIIESNSGKDLTPVLMTGEMERRISEWWHYLDWYERSLMLDDRKYVFFKFEKLPKEIKLSIINKLT